jgi:uncharacterized cupredoxin-like copper-binding protein
VIRSRTSLVLPLLLAACHGAPPPRDVAQIAAPSSVDWGTAAAVTVRMSDFAFAPSRLALRAEMPARLMLVNDSGNEHIFSAPGFFSGSAFGPGSPALEAGAVTIPAHGTVELKLVPGQAGNFPFECTEPLHAMFGMTGAVEVAAR